MKHERHFELFIKNFVAPHRTGRYLALLGGNPKQQKKVWNLVSYPELNEDQCEDIGECTKGMKDDEKIRFICNRLAELGASGECTVWSEATISHEALTMSIADAVELAVKSSSSREPTSTLVSCIPGRLAFWQGDWVDDCCICTSK